ncbi:MAG TPA: PilT/PilU family type 4a pilus ATPase [Gammaproteobacteria bacterium]|nr:PilT/PilU family type 4a pilus ATPase [Gammaproteobacteria bacterium]
MADSELAARRMQELLRGMIERGASDLFVTAGAPPAIRVDGEVHSLPGPALTSEESAALVRAIMNDRQNREFDATKECNFAISPQDIGRFRVSAFVQRGRQGAVLRTISATIPTVEELNLPAMLKDIVMTPRGLVIVVGATGAGKTTTLAAMMDHRNHNSHGHIVTVEDPIEYLHEHAGCVVTQREVGVDTTEWRTALKNVMRQAPDVVQIGEIRDRETMEQAVIFSETGHLCLATLHATNANQALDRIINLYPQERRQQLLMDLSFNLKAVVSQRLLRRAGGEGRIPAVEILINTPLVSDMIFKGDVTGLKEIMARSAGAGMQTFDQSLFGLYEAAAVSYEEAIRNADSRNELRLRIKLESKRETRRFDDDLESVTLESDGEGRRIG